MAPTKKTIKHGRQETREICGTSPLDSLPNNYTDCSESLNVIKTEDKKPEIDILRTMHVQPLTDTTTNLSTEIDIEDRKCEDVLRAPSVQITSFGETNDIPQTNDASGTSKNINVQHRIASAKRPKQSQSINTPVSNYKQKERPATKNAKEKINHYVKERKMIEKRIGVLRQKGVVGVRQPSAGDDFLRSTYLNTMKFIEELKKEECLWNSTSPEYYNPYKRYLAAESIARKLKAEGTEARHVTAKFNCLRTCYGQHLDKIKESEEAVARGESDELYRPPVAWFAVMDSFYRPHFDVRPLPPIEKPPPLQEATQNMLQCDKVGMSYKLSNRTSLITTKTFYPSTIAEDTFKGIDWTETDKSQSLPVRGEKYTIEGEPHVKKEPQYAVEMGKHVTQGQYVKEAQHNIVQEQNNVVGKRQLINEGHYVEEVQHIGQEEYFDGIRHVADDVNQIFQIHSTSRCLQEENRIHSGNQDYFAQHIASLLKRLPLHKASEVQPKIVDLIVSYIKDNSSIFIKKELLTD